MSGKVIKVVNCLQIRVEGPPGTSTDGTAVRRGAGQQDVWQTTTVRTVVP